MTVVTDKRGAVIMTRNDDRNFVDQLIRVTDNNLKLAQMRNEKVAQQREASWSRFGKSKTVIIDGREAMLV